MASVDTVVLNFLAVEPGRFRFDVYRRPYAQDDPLCVDAVGVYKMPRESENLSGEYAQFCVSFDPRAGYESVACDAGANIYLTEALLFRLLSDKTRNELHEERYAVIPGFRRRIAYVLATYPEGQERVWVAPYYLKSTREFGFLADFEFRRNVGVPYSRRIQQLSLSLNREMRQNRDFYVDRYNKLQAFVTTVLPLLFPLSLGGGFVLGVRDKLRPLPSGRLKTKTYMFNANLTAKSQFMGVKAHGPLEPIDSPAVLAFIYRPPDKPLSYDLFRALRGETYATFPGMEKVFKYPLTAEHVLGAEVASLEVPEVEKAIAWLKRAPPGQRTVPVVLLPWDKDDCTDAEREAYFRLKYRFLEEGMPTQFVSLPTVRDRDQLKWAVSNIALGIFCKMGGIPWKVVPREARCLIVGIGQAHRVVSKQVERFYAYCILTESSGLYRELRVLGDSPSHESYLAQFADNLTGVLKGFADEFDGYVIHSSFRLRQGELDTIQSVLRDYAKRDATKRLVALKFNEQSRFFGFAPANNSLVPFESTFVQLSPAEYLVWFEGLQYHRPTVDRRFGAPVHVQITYPEGHIAEEEKEQYLQDAINLSGANWRGFNAKSSPVSIYYAHEVARFFLEFTQLGLPLIDLSRLTPWFL
jgi:hypothetical protein